MAMIRARLIAPMSKLATAKALVAKARRSTEALAKVITGRTVDGLRVHGFHGPLAELATLTRSTVSTALNPNDTFTVDTRPAPIHNKAFELLGVKPERTR